MSLAQTMPVSGSIATSHTYGNGGPNALLNRRPACGTELLDSHRVRWIGEVEGAIPWLYHDE